MHTELSQKGRHQLGKDDIKMDLKVMKLEDMNWIHLAQDRVKWLQSSGVL
jgi:hypothetical protein